MAFDKILSAITAAKTWDDRVTQVRRIPELHGTAEQGAVYSAIAEELYVPALSPQFAHIPWRDDYELSHFRRAYTRAAKLTSDFRSVSDEEISKVLQEAPESLTVFRTIIGYTPNELAVAVSEVREQLGGDRVSQQRIKAIEAGKHPSEELARSCATTINRLIERALWTTPSTSVRSKLEKPDTHGGWDTVRGLALRGVPYEVFLHQRHYGGAFRQLLDATSSVRGELLELPVQELLLKAKVPFIRTGAHNQKEIGDRFGITIRPAPDFVVHDDKGNAKALIECKQANDGGTARDKAARFRSLRQEGTRLGGIPVVAVLDGLGWERVNDALGPVVRDTDGRVFTLATLPEMIQVQPFADLKGLAT